uniref:IrrE N-terminal-like domain-containing protein n=1 Tax=uncultured Desulfobacterium sp. TaxID=201089 RepID=E1YCI5_9BACT|nr:hypothetical protein N47_G36030 [uncultured Desulfobacterium sp.]
MNNTELDSAEDIAKYARQLLRAADVGDRLPTPQEDILNCAKLVLSGGIDIDDYKESFWGMASSSLISGLEKILGILDVREKTIIISPDVTESKKPFITFHEVSHDMLPWQVETYKYFEDNYETLRPDIARQFEKEANYGSVQLLFQCDRFEKEAREFDLSLRTGIKLKQDYGASFHSTFWNYVATHSKSCALFVMQQCKYSELYKGNMEQPYELLYPVASKKFINEFNGTCIDNKYYSDHPFTQIMNKPIVGVADIYDGEILLKNKNGERVDANFEAWTNSYNLFVLIWKKSRFYLYRKRIVFDSET